jgi:hypothetical protein
MHLIFVKWADINFFWIIKYLIYLYFSSIVRARCDDYLYFWIILEVIFDCAFYVYIFIIKLIKTV